MNLNELLSSSTSKSDEIQTMPVLFVGHGNPMNAIQENAYTHAWQAQAQSIPKPRAVLCISAHWETSGTMVTAMPTPPTIHDFGGFPKELFAVEYPALGSLEVAMETKDSILKAKVALDQKWGLDHGCWSVLKHFYPKADVPVLQLSLDYTKPPQYHYELGKELSALRRKGILIVGSGNVVHNLRMVDWQNPSNGFDWAKEANNKIKQLITANDHQSLINYTSLGREINLSIPTPEHFLPLLYTLALKTDNEDISFFNDQLEMGSLAMTSLRLG